MLDANMFNFESEVDGENIKALFEYLEKDAEGLRQLILNVYSPQMMSFMLIGMTLHIKKLYEERDDDKAERNWNS